MSVQVLGIDPSLTCTGFATVGEAGALFPSRVTTQPARTLEQIDARVRYITGCVLRFAPASDLFTVIESPYIPRHGAGQVLERAWLFGMLVDQLLLRGPVVAVPPMVRAKYGAGSGNAKKAAVLAAVREAYPAVRVRDDNEADAIVLASMGARFLGMPIDGSPSKAQVAAMSAVHWPADMKEKDA